VIILTNRDKIDELEKMSKTEDFIRMDKLIRKFIKEKIALSQIDISESAKSREWLLNKIKNKINEREGEPTLYKPQLFVYFGSYFKGTKVKNVDEYDVLVVIDSYTGYFEQKGVRIGDGLGSANPNHKYDQKYKKSDGSGVSPSKLLNWLKSIVTEVVESYGGTAPIRNGQAITARIESKDINIDLVPAGIFQHTEKQDTIFYDIPKGDKNNGWILTNPLQDITLINELAKDRDNFRNIIRLVKFSRDNYNFKISSFAIECCIVKYAEEVWFDSTFMNLLLLLLYFSDCLNSKAIFDTFDENNNLLENVESTEWYAERIEKIIELLLESGDEEDNKKAYQNLVNVLSNSY